MIKTLEYLILKKRIDLLKIIGDEKRDNNQKTTIITLCVFDTYFLSKKTEGCIEGNCENVLGTFTYLFGETLEKESGNWEAVTTYKISFLFEAKKQKTNT